MLPGFILPAALETLAAEASAISDQAYFCKNTHNAYLTDDDADLPENDVGRIQEQTYGIASFDVRSLFNWKVRALQL